MITVGSLFSGIGGVELGLECTGGFETVWQVEKDAYCRKVLAKHWPSVARFEDIRDVGAENLDAADLICGGFPCQDVSIAGNREGIDGARSGLWTEFHRVLGELRPRYALIENVPGLRYKRGGFGVVLRDLAEIGYDAEWESIPAGLFGAPHKRERIFVVGYPHDSRESNRPIYDEAPRLSEMDSHPEHTVGARSGSLGRTWRGRQSLPWNSTGGCTDSTLAVRVDDGLPHRMDRLRALGNAVVPQVAEFVGECILKDVHRRGENT